jgi:histidinol-phosphate aminotransferase
MGVPMNLVRPSIEALTAYVPGKPIEELRLERGIEGEILKLASNENVLGTSPRAIEAAQQALADVSYYPDGGSYFLRKRLGEDLDVPTDNLIIGSGSTGLIELLSRTFVGAGEHAVISAHSFVMYKLALQATGATWTEVPMKEPLTHDLQAMATAVQPRTKLVFVANPNNPTGTYNSRDELEAFLGSLNRRKLEPVVVIDEAYLEFCTRDDYPDSLTLRHLYPRLVTLRTFSKCYGMAGFRIGYGVAHQVLIEYLNRVRSPFNVGSVSQAAAVAALDDVEFLLRSIDFAAEARVDLTAKLEAMGLRTWESVTNFLLCELPKPGAEVFDDLLNEGVIVRPMAGYGLPKCVRITVSTADHHNRLVEALNKVLDL